MTNQQITATLAAQDQARRLIATEMRYLPQHRKPEYLASLRDHIAKLDGMIWANAFSTYLTPEVEMRATRDAWAAATSRSAA